MSQSTRPRRAPTRSRLPTIRDVARLAGVGKTTVSDALQGRGRIAPETRERVLAAVEQLGYRANLGARDLTRQRTEVIGVVVGDFFDPFSAELTGRLEQHAAANGFRVLLSTAGPELQHEASAIGSLLEYRVAALVLVAFTGDEQELLEIGRHTPVVCIGYEGPCGVSIGIDDKRGGDVATAHLAELGHTRIAYVSAAVLPHQTDDDRLAGYRRALRRAGIGSDRLLVERLGRGQPEEARKQRMRALLSQDDRPTAVFAASDITAIEVMTSAAELGLRIPQDLSVVGFDDIALARVPMLALTTVAQPIAELAQRGIDAAIALIEDPGAVVDAPRIEPQLVVRGTTAPPD